MEFSESGLLAVGYKNGYISIFSKEGEEEMNVKAHKSGVTKLKFNSDSTQFCSGGEDTEIVVWDLLSGTGLYRFKGHKGSITGLSFLEKSNSLISTSKDMLIKLWELETQHCIQTLIGTR
jgi:U3 small nucleolar RNA-associated protein 12